MCMFGGCMKFYGRWTCPKAKNLITDLISDVTENIYSKKEQFKAECTFNVLIKV